ncbi:MAG: ankyrin repeat-containing domain protein [Benjaminiella poitrasii]|nr:MAG: ankyrin repeat-containing domain protein [Benjaminiella poitrasii]
MIGNSSIDRLVTMLEQHSQRLESENRELKLIIAETQRKYEKAVREMQFYKKRCEQLTTANGEHKTLLTPSSSPSLDYQWPASPTSIASDASSTRRRTNSNTTATGSIFSGFSSHSSSSSYITTTTSTTNSDSIASRSAYYDLEHKKHPVSLRSNMIQQRKTDPLTFGGSDALWDTIAKNQSTDTSVEKIITNFLRRGGSPNTAKQSPSMGCVKYGYGMIHALIVTKASSSLDLLLQQGANPNVVSMSQVDEEKVSPCYLAASIGWLIGLQKIVQAGGDLMSARGAGAKKKNALQAAAEYGHAAVFEYIVNMTEGVLNLETDALGANVLHYACASGHTELVSYIIKICQVPVNEADRRGELPIHWAARCGRLEVVALLIERYGSNINPYVTKKVGTPYDIAKASGYKRLVEYLKQHGGVAAKKMEKRKEDDLIHQVPKHLENVLSKNGFFIDEESF